VREHKWVINKERQLQNDKTFIFHNTSLFLLIFDIGMQLVNVDFKRVYNGVIRDHYKLRLIKIITIK